MSMSFTDRAPRLLLAAILAGGLAACSTAPRQQAGSTTDGVDNVNVIKPVRAQAAAPAAVASDTAHVTTVTASPQAQAAAQQAAPEYFAAMQLLQAGKLDEAHKAFAALAAKFPGLSGPVVNQALIQLRNERWDDAIALADRALKINARNPFAWNIRGMALREQGKFADARKAYESALAIDPNYAKAHFNLGVLADLYLQELPLALAHYEKYQALQRKPDQAVGNWIADLRNRLGLPAAAAPAAAPAPATAPAGSGESAPATGNPETGTDTIPAQAG